MTAIDHWTAIPLLVSIYTRWLTINCTLWLSKGLFNKQKWAYNSSYNQPKYVIYTKVDSTLIYSQADI